MSVLLEIFPWFLSCVSNSVTTTNGADCIQQEALDKCQLVSPPKLARTTLRNGSYTPGAELTVGSNSQLNYSRETARQNWTDIVKTKWMLGTAWRHLGYFMPFLDFTNTDHQNHWSKQGHTKRIHPKFATESEFCHICLLRCAYT